MPSYKQSQDYLEVEIERKDVRTTVDIVVRCPICKLSYYDYDVNPDMYHYIECDRCGTKYKYNY